MRRTRVDLPHDPLEVALRLRDRPRLTVLLGRWHDDVPVLTWDPLRALGPDDDPFDLTLPRAGTDRAEESGRLGGGWFGVLGYQLGRDLEPSLRARPAPRRPLPQPHHRLALHDRVLVRRPDGWWVEQLTGLVDPAEEERRHAAFLADLATPTGPDAVERPVTLGPMTAVPEGAEHERAVALLQDAIVAGELFQANLTMRLEGEVDGDPLDLFVRGCRALRPAYAAFLRDGDAALVSLSPELFLRRRGHHVLTSPIKGTAPSGQDPAVLATSAKDRAENVMIVDLMRNDLARVCRAGTVRVPALNRVEEHSVRHLVSDVVGELRDGVDDGDLLRATFPPGSVTGAPKVAAMAWCDRLEATAREAYTGALGYVSPAAGLELSVVIRTLEVDGRDAWLGVGGGITVLSDPEAELAEAHAKAAPLLRAFGPAPRVLLLDNYDSFVHNLAHYVEEAGGRAIVVRHDAIDVEELAAMRERGDLTHLLVSPGPAAPAEAGVSVEAVRRLAPTTPVLGVCLGHQVIGAAFGADVVRARRPVHGRSEPIEHDGRGVLHGLPAPLEVARYHSLVLDPATLPAVLEPTAWTADGELMGVRHRDLPHVEGLQWHPESILTDHGRAVVRAFLAQPVPDGPGPDPAQSA